MADNELIEIRIPLLVGMDGKWAANGGNESAREPDWSFLEDCLYNDESLPAQRYWITAYVKRPKTGEIAGSASPEGSPQERGDAE